MWWRSYTDGNVVYILESKQVECDIETGATQSSHTLDYGKHNAEIYPQPRIPLHTLFNKIHQGLSNSEPFVPWASDHGKPRSARTPSTEVRVLRRVQEVSGSSLGRTAAADGRRFPCLENSPWTITLPTPHPARANINSSWLTRRDSILPMTSREMICELTIVNNCITYSLQLTS
jgi:hypothetical protein